MTTDAAVPTPSEAGRQVQRGLRGSALTTVAARLRLGRRAADALVAQPAGRGRAAGLAVPPVPTAGRAVTGDPDALVARARRLGADERAIDALVLAWAALPSRLRAQVLDPWRPDGDEAVVEIGDMPARQAGPTSCGAAVLVLLEACGDPFLALWLVSGHLVTEHVPHPDALLALLDPADLAGRDSLAEPLAYAGPEQVVLHLDGVDVVHPRADVEAARPRWIAAQRTARRGATRRTLGPASWPDAWGTPPWGLAKAARFPRTHFRSVLVDDTDRVRAGAVVNRAVAALEAGIPVPLYTSGSLREGLGRAVPRHVVLLTSIRPPDPARNPREDPADGPVLAVYEPSSALVFAVRPRDLLEPGPRAAWGGWSHVCWAVLPTRL